MVSRSCLRNKVLRRILGLRLACNFWIGKEIQ